MGDWVARRWNERADDTTGRVVVDRHEATEPRHQHAWASRISERTRAARGVAPGERDVRIVLPARLGRARVDCDVAPPHDERGVAGAPPPHKGKKEKPRGDAPTEHHPPRLHGTRQCKSLMHKPFDCAKAVRSRS